MTDYSNSTNILSVGNLTNVTLLPEIPFEPVGLLDEKCYDLLSFDCLLSLLCH